MTICSLGEGISLSNDGAALIGAGMLGLAIPKLTCALRTCRNVCAQQTVLSESSKTDISSVGFELDVLFNNTANSPSPNKDLDGFVFQHPLRVPTLLKDCENSSHLVMTVICFNLGIAYHVLALNSESSQREALLKRALHLYKTAEKIQRKSSKSSKALFAAAILNNIAHIFKTLRQPDLSKAYYSRLLSLIIYMVSFKKEGGEHYEEYLSFLLPRHCITASTA